MNVLDGRWQNIGIGFPHPSVYITLHNFLHGCWADLHEACCQSSIPYMYLVMYDGDLHNDHEVNDYFVTFWCNMTELTLKFS